MIPPVLLIRSQPGADETAGQIDALGCQAEVIVSPVLQVKPLSLPNIPTEAELIFTSPNGVSVAAGLVKTHAQNPVWCVASRTAEAARAAGFKYVFAGDSDGVALAQRILSEARDNSGEYYHLGNKATSGDVVGILRQAGRMAQFHATYQAVAATQLNVRATRLITGLSEFVLLLHSKAAAQAFSVLYSQQEWERMHCIAISAQAASGLAKQHALASLHIAERPNSAAMLKQLKIMLLSFE